MKISNILIGVAGAVIGAGALYGYNKFIGGGAAPADDECTDECDDDVVDEEPATEE